MEVLIDDINWIRGYTIGQIKGDIRIQDRLKEIYYNAFLEKLIISCGNCISDAIIRLEIFLKRYYQQKNNAMNDTKYRLKRGFIIDLTYSGGGYVTADNITDDVARELIRKNRAYLDFFEAYPKDEVRGIFEGKIDDAVTDEDLSKDSGESKTDEKADEAKSDVPTHDQLAVKTKAELFIMLGDSPRVNKEELIKLIIEKYQKG